MLGLRYGLDAMNTIAELDGLPVPPVALFLAVELSIFPVLWAAFRDPKMGALWLSLAAGSSIIAAPYSLSVLTNVTIPLGSVSALGWVLAGYPLDQLPENENAACARRTINVGLVIVAFVSLIILGPLWKTLWSWLEIIVTGLSLTMAFALWAPSFQASGPQQRP